MKKMVNGVVHDITPEEIEESRKKAEIAQAIESNRPLTESEVSRMLITAQINTLTVDDHTALRMRAFYPEWAPDTAYTAGFKIQHGGKLWRCVLSHSSQTGWEPSTDTASMWERINETHTGEAADPIPYEGNMVLSDGSYYIQDAAIYRCIRDSINPLYQPLWELVGIYVEEV